MEIVVVVAVLGAVQSSGSAAGNSLTESSPNRGPHFDTSASKNVTALLGKTAYLNCRVKNLANRTVSGWETITVEGALYSESHCFVARICLVCPRYYVCSCIFVTSFRTRLDASFLIIRIHTCSVLLPTISFAKYCLPITWMMTNSRAAR